MWGAYEDEWQPASCKLLLKPEDIPKDNLTTPVWPRAFTAMEYAFGTGSGSSLDACQPPYAAGFQGPPRKKGEHSHYFDYYDQYDMSEFPTIPGWPLKGPQPVQRTHFGLLPPNGKDNLDSEQWTLPNGNMFSKTGPMCVCFSDPNRQPRQDNASDPHPGYEPGGDPSVDPFPKFDNVLLGPLRWDFPGDAILIGREEIVVEAWGPPPGEPTTFVADHWNKGPHHFHFDVKTNLMVRQYQAETALTCQTQWNLTRPDPYYFQVDKACYHGLTRMNLSCIAPPPQPPPRAE